MPLDILRLRATEAIRGLGSVPAIVAPTELKVAPLCEALLAVRDLLQCYGDARLVAPGPLDATKTAILQVLAHDLPHLVLALEIFSSRASSILKLAEQERHGEGG
jgi:hypothetical protein